jgi:hypothetical protein
MDLHLSSVRIMCYSGFYISLCSYREILAACRGPKFPSGESFLELKVLRACSNKILFNIGRMSCQFYISFITLIEHQ